jgi:predicted enzyme related to lactoylglutathione lyase
MNITFTKIILFGEDVNKLKKFYIEHFNCTLVEEINNEWVVLATGQIEIAFHKIGGHKQNSDKPFKVESNIKLVFEVKGDLAVFRTKLLEKGVLLKEITSFAGVEGLFCDGEDPEGNIFQLTQRAA